MKVLTGWLNFQENLIGTFLSSWKFCVHQLSREEFWNVINLLEMFQTD